QPLVLAQRPLRDLRRHVGIAVAVASDPAPEPEEGADREGAFGILASERGSEPPHELGGKVEERALEVVEPVDDLIDHARSVAPRLLRLPERDHLLADELE